MDKDEKYPAQLITSQADELPPPSRADHFPSKDEVGPDIISQLEEKVVEYKKRLKSDLDAAEQLDLIAKIIFSQTFLRNEKVNVGEITRSIKEEHEDLTQHMNDEELNVIILKAFFVIRDYIKTGGKNVTGGTGLDGLKK